MILDLDTAIRLIAIGAGFALLLAILSGNIIYSVKLSLSGVLVGGTAYLIVTSKLNIASSWSMILDLLTVFTPFWTWVFARQIFDRLLNIRTIWGIVGIYMVLWIIAYFNAASLRPIGFFGIHFLSIALIGDIIRISIIGHDDDLVEKRRLIRIWLPLLIGLFAASILLTEMIYWPNMSDMPPWIRSLGPINILSLVLLGVVALLRSEDDIIPKPIIAGEPAAQDTLSASENVLRNRLNAVMDSGFYRETGLTITALAAELDTPEHRLRALINRSLGHRNFSNFLNSYRIAEAKLTLADTDAVDTPILTIAMELGYNALATFNRAFKSHTGETPSEYRQKKLGAVVKQK